MAPVVDEPAKAAGLIRMALTVEVAEFGPVELVATFPDFYPYLRPEVAAPALALDHHQNPFSRYLCLIGRSTANWGTSDTLAGLLTEQLTKVLFSGAAAPPAGAARDTLPEEQQAEPYSEYYSYAAAAMFLIDGAWSLPIDARYGELTLGSAGPLPPSDNLQEHTLAVVREVRDQRGETIASAPPALAERFPGDMPARWSRLEAPVPSNEPEAIWAAAEAADAGGEPTKIRPGSPAGAPIQLRAVVFPEEVAWRTSGDGWVFLVRQPGTTVQVRPSKRRGVTATNRTLPARTWLVRAGRIGPSDLAARVPELAGLASRRAAVIGAGALGSAICDQLARAGLGSLAILDRDVLEAGNTVRHAAPYRLAGLHKAVATSQIAASRSPYLESRFAATSIGMARTGPLEDSDAALLANILHGAHLLIDATAELGLQHLLADEARDRGILYLCVTATNGGWGGMVTLIRPGTRAGCWNCLMHHMHDSTIPTPPSSPSDLVQPPGCANPTFTGAGFDLDQIALNAVRVAVGALLAGQEHGYPAPPHDVSVLTLRDPEGQPTLPVWTGYPLTRHPQCANHQQ